MANTRGALRILIAEDDALTRLILQKCVTGLGHECLVAKDGTEAWEKCQNEVVDVVLSDWMMPGLEGPELCRRIRQSNQDRYVYVILLTSLEGRQHFMDGMQAGADDYLLKPLNPEDLQARLVSAARVTGLHRNLAEQKAELERLNAHLSDEMQAATRVQSALIPKAPAVEGFDLSWRQVTASEVGGDLIDFYPGADGAFWIAIGDVTGHGLTPGLIMMMTQSILAGLLTASPHLGPAEVLNQLNRVLYQNLRYRMETDHFLTLQLIRHMGDGHFVTAGRHCDMLLHRAERREVEVLETLGFWSGLVEDTRELMVEHAFDLAPGDTLLLYTDGLIEAMDARRQQFDLARLETAFRRNAAREVGELEERLIGEVTAWLHTQRDDISTILVRRLGSGAGECLLAELPRSQCAEIPLSRTG